MRYLIRIKLFTIMLLTCLVLSQSVLAESLQAGPSASYPGKPVKYIFLMIGDGMGIAQRIAAQEYSGKQLVMDTFPAQGLTTTRSNDNFITGSAAAATAIACGKKTNSNHIGVDINFALLPNIAEIAKKNGQKVGIISSVSIDHATPAAFYAHVAHRKMYYNIAMALATSNFDFFGGGGLKDPAGKREKSPGSNALKTARANGYNIVSDKNTFMALDKNSPKTIAWNARLNRDGSLPYSIDMDKNDITLSEFTSKAIELLDNPKGFFLMVEAGKIDWACHANDAATAITENLAFDHTVQLAYDFYLKHRDETLIVVTGDHECGGLALGFAGTKYATHFQVLRHQKISFHKFSNEIVKPFKLLHGPKPDFEKFKPIITQYFGLKFVEKTPTRPDTLPEQNNIMELKPHEIARIKTALELTMNKKEGKSPEQYLLYGDENPLTVTLTHTMSQKAGLGWTSYKHTGIPVSTSAVGPGSEMFNGYYDNTDIHKKILSIMGLD